MTGVPVQIITNSFLVASTHTETILASRPGRITSTMVCLSELCYAWLLESLFLRLPTVAFNPADPKPQKRQRLIHALQVVVYPNIFTPRAVYDGSRLLYSSKIIENGVVGRTQKLAGLVHHHYQSYRGQTNRPLEFEPAHAQRRGNGTRPVLTPVARTSPPKTREQLNRMPVELWRGFYQIVRPSIGRLLVTVDTTVAAFYKPGPLIDVCMELLNTSNVRRLGLSEGSEDFRKLERHLMGRLISVKTRRGQPPRTKTVRALAPGPVGNYRFSPTSNGPMTTVTEHFKQYIVMLAYPGTIGVVTSGKGAPFKVIIPLELCALVPGQLYKKKLPLDATASIVRFAALAPAKRLSKITGGEGQLRSPIQDYRNSEYLVDAGMQIAENPFSIRGRLLQAPPLLYQGSVVSPRDGAWNVLGARFHTPRQMLNWGMINFDPQHINEQVVENTWRTLVTCCNMLGMNVVRPRAGRNGNGQDAKGAIEALCTSLGGDLKQIHMIVFLLPAKADELRTRIKYICDTELGVRSQCLREPKLQRANNQYFNNVALKINARLGGSNMLVDSPVLNELKTKPFMCFGADVAHPGPGANRPSVASLVWSHDIHGAAYCATTRIQLPRTEIITDLGSMVETAVMMFGAKHNKPPANILFFRDGVSEGEFTTVKNEEISQINEALERVWTAVEPLAEEPKPNVTFIIVGKRHHVSFFPRERDHTAGDKTGNCKAGLCVDAELANPQFPDFYLQSHAAIKGTSRSAHYTVLQDQVFGGDLRKLQELAFALCHIYAKATRSVSIPAPVYYADLACSRGKFHFDPSSDVDIEGSTSSGGNGVFQLQPWLDAFQPMHDNVKAFNPADPKPQKRQRLIQTLQINAYPQVFTPRAVYDGNRLLYLSKEIQNGVDQVPRARVQPGGAPKDAPGWYDITISRTAGKPIIPSSLNKLMLKGEGTVETTTATNLLQLLLTQNKNQASPNTGRAYFTPDDRQPLKGMPVELWRGFYQIMRPSIGRLLVTVDTTVAAFYKPGPLIDVCMELLNAANVRRLGLSENHEDYKKIERHLKNRLISVKTRYGEPPRTKTVRALAPGPVGDYRFSPTGSGPTTTIAEHFKQHNVMLTYPGTIGVVTSGKGAPFKVVIPLELCALVPGQLYKKKLPPDATASVVSFAALQPAQRLSKITSGEGQLHSPIQDYKNSEYLADAGMQIGENPLSIRGRLLQPPPLLYQGSTVSPRDGAWNVLGARFHTPRQMLNWGIINFDPQRINDRVVQKSAQDLVTCCNTLGMNVAPPRAQRNGNGQDAKGAIRALCTDLGGDMRQIDMVIFLLPAKADELRTRIKCPFPMLAGAQASARQQSTSLSKSMPDSAARTCSSTPPVLKELKTKPFMCFGADVAHPGPGANRPSVASLVWSHDMNGAAYCATTRVQLPRSEIITDLGSMVEKAVMMFGAKHKVPPANILFFRDGVSEGEFTTVRKEEISQIDGNTAGDKTGNCKAGLCVDEELANPQFPDFYLQSHAAIKGTSRSAHYTVLQDQVFGGNLQKLQDLAFALCHIYAKATRSVSIPAPVYYADLACSRGKFHFDPSSDMDIEGSTSSGGNGVFQLQPWLDAFKDINNNVKGSMFFL
ncbi:Argonaute-like protein [Mycena sanguinolenta]|uniref:Argonaute-like protein n=1 Tax=Mycena sanguinolenta TaxID=230812 RepID=A0A8H7D272_9AGAR|nr:Argonaute-like protein [Mycena sanguinolenta]